MRKVYVTAKSRTITGILALLCCLISCRSGNKIISMEFKADSLTVIHIHKPERYLLFPVEEKAPERQVSIVEEKGETLPVHIRLAQTRVDYYVPYELPKEAGEIRIHIRKALKQEDIAVSQMELSNVFDTTNREKYRPVYHFSPPYGWMNDPNGLVYLDGEYHLFYQYNPYGSMWGNMHWGHAVSKDLMNWEHLPVAIFPDQLGTVFSGNCIIDTENTAGFGKNAMIAFYTSAGKQQTQSIAYSTDKGRTFRKYDKNPIITADIPDFRDPNVFYHEATGRWMMVIAAGQEVQLFSSANLLEWQYESSFGEGYGNHGGVWECPDLLELPVEGEPGKTKWVLIVNINPGGIFGGSATQYFTGEFDGIHFTCESTPETVKWMDWGKDHYAAITWSNAPDNRKIAIAWMSNWQYANEVPSIQFRSVSTVPRDISLVIREKENWILQKPVVEREVLRVYTHKILTFTTGKTHTIDLDYGNQEGAYELVIDFENISAQVFGFTLFNAEGNKVDIYYDTTEQRFYMDRTKSGLTSFSPDFPTVTYAPVEKSDSYQLHLLLDKCSIEAFAGDGRFAMTNLVFPESPYNRINFYSKGGTFDVSSMQIYLINTH